MSCNKTEVTNWVVLAVLRATKTCAMNRFVSSTATAEVDVAPRF